MKRRSFVKTLGAMGLAAIPSNSFGETNPENKELYSLLIDTTLCAGCRSCEMKCAEVNNLPEPDTDESVFETVRNTSTKQYSLINRFEIDDEEIFVKKQCMHCSQPACASACLTNAMLKTEDGPVIWRADKCMGCRFCMLSCPFDIPKFEYESSNPKIQKCSMCFSRLKKGNHPACVEECPAEAITYGKRGELIAEANRRIYESPEAYVNKVYGEHEVGGTSALYLSAVPFEKIGFKTNLGNKAFPEFTTEFLYSVPIIETILPPLLLAISLAAKVNREEKENE